MSILDLLVQKKIISATDVAGLKDEIKKADGNVDEVLLQHGINPQDVLTSKGEYFNLPVKALDSNQKVAFDILKYVPEDSARYYRFVPLGLTEGVLEVGFVDPDNIEARDALNFISAKINLPFKIFLISEEDFNHVIEMYKGLSGEVTKALGELETELDTDKKSGGRGQNSSGSSDSDDMVIGNAADSIKKGETKIIEDAPITKIVATILHYAAEGNASDIHIEAMEDTVRVRFRVDGVLTTSIILPLKIHSALVARIKILANMRLDEKRKPQDGRFQTTIDGRRIDFRVSTFPAYYGEKIVMRILDSEKGIKGLDQMGLSPRNLRVLRDAIKRPYGLILISGPTGSGKSTTLYSMLNEIDKETKNVLSLEDPIEYNMKGINQSQVRPEIGYTFANGLRTTLRQDPDIIMVGEIRDKETAQLAVQAALTGHLVLSTIHTNNALGVIPRLMEMGVDPYLIAPTLILAMAQRLVKLLCPGTGKPVPIDGVIRTMIDNEFADVPAQFKSDLKIPNVIYEIQPTPECPKGTSGRMAVVEVLEMDKDLEKVILKNPTDVEIMKVARAQGMLTLKEDAIIKAFDKLIPFEEVNRV